MRAVAAVLCMAALVGLCGLKRSGYCQEMPYPELASRIITELSEEKYGAFWARCDDTMKAAIGSESKVAEMWKTLTTVQLGAFKSQGAVKHQKTGPFDVVQVTCQFEKSPLVIQLAFNAQRRISGIQFLPAVASENRPQDPRKPYPYQEEEVAYDSKEPGIKLAGTLTFPKSGGPFPAVLLITGSGAQNRNEEIMGHKPFLVLADHLTRLGIAVLRVDDRGVGGSSMGSPQGGTSADFAKDVLAGVEYLKSRREINPSRIGLIGHSEGGMIAPMVACQSADVAFIVLMAGTGVKGSEVLLEQGKSIMQAEGANEELIQENIKVQKILFDVIQSNLDNDAAEKRVRDAVSGVSPIIKDAALQQLKGVLSPWMRFFVAYDPQLALQKVKCPVLAMNGGKDLQVIPSQNLPAIEKALRAGGNKDFKTVELPGLNHLFQTCKTGSVAEYGKIDETISPAALDLMSAWILQHTK